MFPGGGLQLRIGQQLNGAPRLDARRRRLPLRLARDDARAIPVVLRRALRAGHRPRVHVPDDGGGAVAAAPQGPRQRRRRHGLRPRRLLLQFLHHGVVHPEHLPRTSSAPTAAATAKIRACPAASPAYCVRWPPPSPSSSPSARSSSARRRRRRRHLPRRRGRAGDARRRRRRASGLDGARRRPPVANARRRRQCRHLCSPRTRCSRRRSTEAPRASARCRRPGWRVRRSGGSCYPASSARGWRRYVISTYKTFGEQQASGHVTLSYLATTSTPHLIGTSPDTHP